MPSRRLRFPMTLALVAAAVASDPVLAGRPGGGVRGSRSVGGTGPGGGAPAPGVSPRLVQTPRGGLQASGGGRRATAPPSASSMTPQQVESLLGEKTPAAQPFAGGSPDAAQAQQAAQQAISQGRGAVSDWQSGPAPFSPAWYAEHPTAWQVTHPHADEAAAAATAAAVAAAATYTPAVANAGAADESYSVYSNYTYEQSAEAVQQGPAGDGGEWVLLGPFDLTPAKTDASPFVLQMHMDRDGMLSGVIIEQSSREMFDVHGRMDQASQTAVWWVSGQPLVTYTAPLSVLTSDKGAVQVTTGQGAQEWRIARRVQR